MINFRDIIGSDENTSDTDPENWVPPKYRDDTSASDEWDNIFGDIISTRSEHSSGTTEIKPAINDENHQSIDEPQKDLDIPKETPDIKQKLEEEYQDNELINNDDLDFLLELTDEKEQIKELEQKQNTLNEPELKTSIIHGSDTAFENIDNFLDEKKLNLHRSLEMTLCSKFNLLAEDVLNDDESREIEERTLDMHLSESEDIEDALDVLFMGENDEKKTPSKDTSKEINPTNKPKKSSHGKILENLLTQNLNDSIGVSTTKKTPLESFLGDNSPQKKKTKTTKKKSRTGLNLSSMFSAPTKESGDTLTAVDTPEPLTPVDPEAFSNSLAEMVSQSQTMAGQDKNQKNNPPLVSTGTIFMDLEESGELESEKGMLINHGQKGDITDVDLDSLLSGEMTFDTKVTQEKQTILDELAPTQIDDDFAPHKNKTKQSLPLQQNLLPKTKKAKKQKPKKNLISEFQDQTSEEDYIKDMFTPTMDFEEALAQEEDDSIDSAEIPNETTLQEKTIESSATIKSNEFDDIILDEIEDVDDLLALDNSNDDLGGLNGLDDLDNFDDSSTEQPKKSALESLNDMMNAPTPTKNDEPKEEGPSKISAIKDSLIKKAQGLNTKISGFFTKLDATFSPLADKVRSIPGCENISFSAKDWAGYLGSATMFVLVLDTILRRW